MLDQNFTVARPQEGHLPGDHLVEHDAEGVHIGALIDVAFAFALLGRHVGRRSHDDARARSRRAWLIACEFCNAEVEKLYEVVSASVLDENNVVGLEVAMDDVCLVRCGECIGNLRANMQGAFGRKWRLLCDDIFERMAVEMLHDEIHHVAAIGRNHPVVDDIDDVGVLDIVDGFGFVEEARHHILVTRELGVQYL